MSNHVEQINDGMEERIRTVLSSFTALNYVLDVEMNSFRKNDLKYGVRPLEAVDAAGIIGSYTQDQPFEIILTKSYVNKKDDFNQREVTFDLYDKMDLLFVDMIHKKIGLPNIITNISEPGISEPEYLQETAVLRGRLLVTYRRALT